MTPDEVPADLRDRIADHAKAWFLNYPIPAWQLCPTREAETRLATTWSTGITDAVMAVVQPELDALKQQIREEIADEIVARALQLRNERAPYISRDELSAYRHAARIARGDA
jgi:hypothetical protein